MLHSSLLLLLILHSQLCLRWEFVNHSSDCGKLWWGLHQRYFQVTAQAGLANSLQPALDHILKVFSTWAPGRGCLKTGYLLQQYDKFKILKWWKCANWKISCKDCLTAQVWDILCFCQCFTLFVILLVGYYHTNFSVVALGLRLVGQLRDEIFLLLHSALQLHYLKVAQTNWIFLVWKKDAINDFQT